MGKIIVLTIVSVIILFLLALTWETCLAGTATKINKPAWMKQKTWDFFERKLNKTTGTDEIDLNRPTVGCVIVALLMTAFVETVTKVACLYTEPPFPSYAWAGILTILMIALSIWLTIRFCHPTKGGESLFEVVLSILLLLAFTVVTLAIASAWSQAFAGHNFWVAVLRICPWVIFIVLSSIIVLRAIFVAYKYKGWYHGWRLFVAIVAALIALAVLIAAIVIGCVAIASATKKANEADAKAAAEAAATTTTETTTTEPEKTSVAKDDKKSEPKAEKPKTEETTEAEEPTSGPNFGITAMGVGFNYIEYNDRYEVNGKKFTAKERWNAFGLNREGVVDKKEQREEVKLVAKEMPEVLAAYSVAFFTDEEKKELGIKGKTAKELDHMFDQPGGGELQEKLYKKLVEIIDSDETQLMDVVVKGWQWSDYLFHKDKDKDGYCSPEEVELCTAKVYRNNQPQLLVQRLINKKWVTVGYLNKKCRYQLSGPDEPKDVPKDPDEPNTPPPTPKKVLKDLKDSRPTTYNQPNENPASHSENTNTGEGSTVSSKEPGSQTGSAPGSADFDKPEDYIEYNQNELKEQQEQQEKNEAAAQNPSGEKVVTTTEDPSKEEKGDGKDDKTGKDNKSNKDDKSKTNTTTDFYSETPEEIKTDKENVGDNGNKYVDFSNL